MTSSAFYYQNLIQRAEKPPNPESTFTPPAEIESVTHENVESHNFNSVSEAAKDDIEAKELEASLMLVRMRQERRKHGLPPPSSSSSRGSHKSGSVKSQPMETHADTVDAGDSSGAFSSRRETSRSFQYRYSKT